jgi:hypothetical protein
MATASSSRMPRPGRDGVNRGHLTHSYRQILCSAMREKEARYDPPIETLAYAPRIASASKDQ